MAANLNKVFLIGNLTRDPELRYTANGSAVCQFTLAVNRRYKGRDGDFKEDTCFIRIKVWGKTGENCANYLQKGRSVHVEGRIESRSWEAEDGSKRSAMEVVAENVQFLGAPTGARQRDHDQGHGGGPPPRGPSSDYGSDDMDLEDDIPF